MLVAELVNNSRNQQTWFEKAVNIVITQSAIKRFFKLLKLLRLLLIVKMALNCDGRHHFIFSSAVPVYEYFLYLLSIIMQSQSLPSKANSAENRLK